MRRAPRWATRVARAGRRAWRGVGAAKPEQTRDDSDASVREAAAAAFGCRRRERQTRRRRSTREFTADVNIPMSLIHGPEELRTQRLGTAARQTRPLRAGRRRNCYASAATLRGRDPVKGLRVQVRRCSHTSGPAKAPAPSGRRHSRLLHTSPAPRLPMPLRRRCREAGRRVSQAAGRREARPRARSCWRVWLLAGPAVRSRRRQTGAGAGAWSRAAALRRVSRRLEVDRSVGD